MAARLDGITRREFLRLGGAVTAILALPSLILAQESTTQESQPTRKYKIFFTEGEGNKSEIYAVDNNGKNLERITNNDYKELDPSVSPDGKLLAYCIETSIQRALSWNHDPKRNLYILNLETDKSILFETEGLSYYNNFCWSKDGKKIGFVADVGFPYVSHYAIWSANSNGSNEKRESFSEGNQWDPTFSPDGKHLAYDYNGTIIIDDKTVVDADRFPNGTSFNPVWSPKGDKIIFTSDRERDDVYKIYIMNPDGSNQEVLVPSAEYQTNVEPPPGVWSPDGTRVAFKNGYMGVVNITTRNVTKIPIKSLDIGPYWEGVHWSPDGNKILFKALIGKWNEKRNSSICRVNLDGSDMEVLREGMNSMDSIVACR